MRYYLIAFVLDKNAVLTPPKICISTLLCVYLMACFTFCSAAQTLNALVPYGKAVMPSTDLNLLLSLFFKAILLICTVSTEDGVLFILYCMHLTISLSNKHFLE